MGDIEAADKVDRRRVYQVWPGNNKFVVGGWFILGPDTNILALTVFLISAPAALFNVFVATELRDWSLGFLIVGIALPVWCLYMLLRTSMSDPGIIPRQPLPPLAPRHLPREQDVMVNGHIVKSKYCDTCNVYRPPRCSHCSVCNNCVERFDHHCPWVGQCVGRRNYRFFMLFITSTTLLCVYVFASCALLLKRTRDDMEGGGVWDAVVEKPVAMILMVFVFLCVWFVGGLSAFHMHLIASNQTTYENFRYHLASDGNPYHEGLLRNCYLILCSAIPASRLSLRAHAFTAGSSTPNYGPAPALPSGVMPLSSEMSSVAAAAPPPPPPEVIAPAPLNGRSSEPQPSSSDHPPMELSVAVGSPGKQPLDRHAAPALPPLALSALSRASSHDTDIFTTPREFGTPVSTPTRASARSSQSSFFSAA